MLNDFENWANFLNNSTQSIHIVDAEGTILWANKPELEFLGYTEEEYFNKPIMDFHVDSDVIGKILQLLTDDASLEAYPARLKAKDGSIKHVLINSNVYRRDGQFIHTRCFTTGISEVAYDAIRSSMAA